MYRRCSYKSYRFRNQHFLEICDFIKMDPLVSRFPRRYLHLTTSVSDWILNRQVLNEQRRYMAIYIWLKYKITWSYFLEYGASGWHVTWKTNAASTGVLLESQTFQGVIVATGIFVKANIPNLPGLSTFPGKILHSNEYKTGQEFEGKNVLIIGGSFSGAEIAADVSTHSRQSYHTFRRRFWVLRRYLPDYQERNGSLIPIDLLFYNRKFYSQKSTTNNDEETEENIIFKKNTNLLSFCQEQQKFEQLKIPKEDFKISINSVISDNYLPQVENGSLVPILGAIKEIQGRTVQFQHGQTLLDVDILIFGTGFQMDNSFFPKAVLDKLKYNPQDGLQPLILFQECFHPDLAGLFFVGMYKGPYFAMMEQQARFACRVLAKIIMLPSKEVTEEGLRKEEEIRNQTFPRPQFPHPEYVSFVDKMASLGHSFPNLDKLLSPKESLAAAFGQTRPSGALIMMEHQKAEIARRFMSEPVTPSHYNFVHSPKQTLNQMDFVQQVLKQFENTWLITFKQFNCTIK